tara:strand:- start:76 stop:558 length:483 start_codon:yes stop_codon:yes gene_type:complete
MSSYKIAKKGKVLLQEAINNVNYKNFGKSNLIEKQFIRDYMNISWGNKTEQEIKLILKKCLNEYKIRKEKIENLKKLKHQIKTSNTIELPSIQAKQREKNTKNISNKNNLKYIKRMKNLKRKIPSSPLIVNQKYKKKKTLTTNTEFKDWKNFTNYLKSNL